jgi:hypothetical protein
MTISATSFTGPVGFNDAGQPFGGQGNIIVFYHMIICPHKAEFPLGGL